jgi:hypothetical protein
MTQDSHIDKLTRDIVMSTALDEIAPEFTPMLMKKIMRESKRRRILENVILCFFMFVAIDTLLYLVVWLTGLNIFEAVLRLVNTPHETIVEAGKLSALLIDYKFIKYILLSLGCIMGIVIFVEAKLNFPEGPNQREN